MTRPLHPAFELYVQGVFRDDFFYRLCSNIIVVPPLRRRLREDPGELDALLAHTLSQMVGEGAERVIGRVRETINRCLPPDYAWPGNVRELEQCVRRILLTNRYVPAAGNAVAGGGRELVHRMEAASLSAAELLSAYCVLLYGKHGTMAEVARLTGLDRRTAKKYVEASEGEKT